MAGRRIALLVATDGYQDPGLNRLRAPARGASELKALLQDPAIGRFDFVHDLVNRPKDEIESLVEELLTDRSPDDLILLYFACHGIRNDADRLFFATLGTQLKRPHTTAIPAAFLHQLLDECEARTKIVLLDCCYSGLFHRGAPMSVAPVDVEGALAGRGTFVITASTALEYAYEGGQLVVDDGLSAPRFTAAVVEGLTTGLADLNRDGVITPEELYTYVHDTVVNQAGPGQTPTKSGQCEGNVPLAYAPWIDAGAGPAARAAVTDELTLGSLLPPPVETVDRGFVCDAWEGASRLVAPIGRVESAAGGDPMCVDLSGRDGNAAIIGKLGSGKTTLLRTLIMSLALTHTPHEAEFYLLEGAVNRLGVLRSLPHVRMHAAPHEHSAVEGALTALKAVISTRRTLFRDLDIDSIEAFRALRATGRIEAGAASDVFLVVDGWLDFCWEHPAFEDTVHKLANTGLNYGVHLLVTARRWNDVSTDLVGLLGTRLELALDTPEESRFDAALASGVSVGWGLSRRRRFRVAVPRFDDGAGTVAARESLAKTAGRVWEGWAALQDGGGGGGAAKFSTGAPDASFTGLLGIADPTSLDLPFLRRRNYTPEKRLTVPIGVREDGQPLVLDLNSGPQQGMGPHGVIVGATGSGKSELLRTIVLGLAVRHTPEEVSFLLVDFKGGATFADLTELPHVSGVVGGLGDDQSHTSRLREALAGEVARRQRILRERGNLTSINAYELARSANPDLAPLPELVLVIDEFSELCSIEPAFLDLFLQIGRVGRALGIHLLLASQRLDEGRLRGLENHLSYRIGLRTFSAAESRAVLGYPDAYHLPSEPGAGYLKADTTDVLVRFKAAYADASVPAPDEAEASGSLLKVVAGQLTDEDARAHRIWLPPLHAPLTMNHALAWESAGHRSGRARMPQPPALKLRAPFAVADDPFGHSHNVLSVDVSGAQGHCLVVGGPQSGKSTLLATLISSFALTHTPAETQFYCLDFGGGQLGSVAELPHVGGVSPRLDGERVRRTVAQVARGLKEREDFFRTHDIKSMARYRSRRAGGLHSDAPWGDVFLVIDGWATFKADYEELEPIVTDIAVRGLDYGVHLMVATPRYEDVRPVLRDHLLGRIELRLSDPAESEIDPAKARNVPMGKPGHGLSLDKLHFLAALLRLDGGEAEETFDQATARLVRTVREQWSGPAAPPVRMLPKLLSVNALPAPEETPGFGIIVGVDESDLTPVTFDFEADPLLLVFGEHESGKTSFLRMLAHQINAKGWPKRTRLIVVDYRRALVNQLPEQVVMAHCMTGPQALAAMEKLTATFTSRTPGPEVPPDQVRSRSWYQDPDVFVLVDDYDLVSTGAGGNPLTPLVDWLPYARAQGLRVILASSSNGAGRASHEPLLRQMMNQGAPGLLLSGDPSEGPLIRTVSPIRRPPGRGTLVTHNASRGIQLGYLPPSHP